METANEIMKQIVPILMFPINRGLRYLILCTKHMREMGIKMTELNDAKVGVEEKTRQNISNHLEVPAQVEGWLKDAGNISSKVVNVSRDIGGCFNLKIRYRTGKNAFEINEEIDSIMKRYKLIIWADHPIPPGMVDSMEVSTSTPSTEHNDFRSREVTFTKALKALGPDHNSHIIALCGMGGVGKTTMMQRLKKVVQEKKMFNFIVEAVIGEKTDPIAIQEAIAYYLGVELNEKAKRVRADKLRQGFKDKSDGGKNKFFVILDDVWESVDLEDIGLSPFPNQGVDFKVLLTSRDVHVCTRMGVEDDSILNMGLLTEAEAQSLFCRFVEPFEPELHKIGKEIVRRCHCLPIAIKTIACTLKNKRKDAWNDALSRLQHHDINNVAIAVFRTSYENLRDKETKFVFLMCGLFPEDFDIPTEELMRYGWGLKLFSRVYTIREARNRLNTCIERLVLTNLLIEGGDSMHVKMHDLVRAFVLGMFSEVEHTSIVNHGNMRGWPDCDMIDSCKTISLTCESMYEFPEDLKFPNLSILKLMYGSKWLRFPRDFSEGMQKLNVISYDKMKHPLLPSSPQCSTNLRVLHLHECSLRIFDCSYIGNMVNLEVLSFAGSDIKWLPSTIGNLKKLRLLDLTDCIGLCIDNGVLIHLVKLEELYMRVSAQNKKAICLTDQNCNEMAERSEKLSALEFEFFGNNAQPKNMSFENLERFKISVGRSLKESDLYRESIIKSKHLYENSLKLVIDKGELLTSRMNELFEKTEVLFLNVGYMNDLSDVEAKSSHPPQSSSFYNLRVLVVSECVELRYLFTLGVAKALLKLEYLEVNNCSNMEELVHNVGSGEETIMLPKLKFLCLSGLLKLSGLCHNVKLIELPQLVELKLYRIPGFTSIYLPSNPGTSCLLKGEVVIPKLEKLHINNMKDLKEIWPSEFGTSEEVNVSILRVIEVSSCDSLVNLFPCNPLSLIHHLEELIVEKCASIEVLFDIKLSSVDVIGEGISSSNLRIIQVYRLEKLQEVWRIQGANNSRLLVHGYQGVESIEIKECKRFTNVFTPITTNFDLGALMKISMINCGENARKNESAKSSQEEEEERKQEQEQTEILTEGEETSEISDCISNVAFPSCIIHSFHNLHKLHLSKYKGMEVVFELVTTRDYEQPILPYLENFSIHHMERMIHLWKCNWNKFFVLQKQQSEYPFHNLKTISMHQCKSIKYLFSPFMAKLLSNLKEVDINQCYGIEEVISNRYGEDEEKTTFTSTTSHTSTTLFPHLDSLSLSGLRNLKCIGGGGANGEKNELSFGNSATSTPFDDKSKSSQLGGVSWTLCQYSRKIKITSCNALAIVIPCYAAGQMQKLQVLQISFCSGMKEVFETKGMNNNKKKKSGCDEGNGAILRLNNVIMLPNLKILDISFCKHLEHIFTFSALESLRQLEELTIRYCEAMKVVVKEEDAYGEQTTTSSSKEVAVFPCLKSIELEALPELVSFFLGNNEFRWPSLDKVTIKGCPQMMVFAPGGSTTPLLKYIHTSLGKQSVEEYGLNFHVTTAAHHQTPFPNWWPATSEGIPWSFHNLIALHVVINHSVKKIIPSNELLQLQKLEEILVSFSASVEEVFEPLEAGKNGCCGFDESQTTLVKLRNLREMRLYNLLRLRYIWKTNQWTAFEFPNLTTVHIRECNTLEHVFNSSMVGSLLQLQELLIADCDHMEEVIVKDTNVVEEESDGTTNETVLPRLKSLTLEWLPCLKGFSLGKEDFSFPSLDTLIIKRCPKMKMFTKGKSATPELKEIETSFCSFYAAGEDINSFIKIKQKEFK